MVKIIYEYTDINAGVLYSANLINAIKKSAIAEKLLSVDRNDPDSSHFTLNFEDELIASDKTILDGLVVNNVQATIEPPYEIQKDVKQEFLKRDPRQINHDTQLNDGSYYTAIETYHLTGDSVGLLDTIDYYRDFVDLNNKGTLVLKLVDVYTLDNASTEQFKPPLSFLRTWKYVKSDSTIDEVNVRKESKIFHDREAQHRASAKRRDVITSQLIDNLAKAAILSGIFTDQDDAFDKLTDLQIKHNAAFAGWKMSGRGPLIDDVENDSTTTWLDSVISNGTNQPEPMNTASPIELTNVSHMMDVKIRDYIKDKLKGLVA